MSDEKKFKEGNLIIAEFMGLSESQKFANGHHLLYSSSWDWLMPVVQKINADYGTERFSHKDWNLKINSPDIRIYRLNSIEETWIAVVEFIKWYNQQK